MPNPLADRDTSAVGARALAALNPGRRATKALAIVAVAAMLVAAYLAWRSRPHEVAVNTVAAATAATNGGDGRPPTTTSPSASASTMLVVAVEGRSEERRVGKGWRGGGAATEL